MTVTTAPPKRRSTRVLIAVAVLSTLALIAALLVILLRPGSRIGGGTANQPSVSYIAQHVWAPEFQGFCDGRSYSGCASTSPGDAGKFPLVVAPPKFFTNSEVTHLKAEHPGIVLLVYLNGVFRNPQDKGPNPDNTGTYPTCSASSYDCAYAYTAPNGPSPHSQIHPRGFMNNYLMNPTDPTWVQSRAAKCAAYVAREHLSGCFFDTIGPAPTDPGYVTPGLPYDAGSNADWTPSDWTAAIVNMLNTVRADDKPALVYGNGLGSGSKYFAAGDPTATLYDALDGAMAEEFVKGPGKPPSSSVSDWLADVRMLIDAGNQGKVIITTTKSWESPPASQSQKDAWHMFALGTFLLGSSQYSYFDFQYAHSRAAPTQWTSWWDTAIGVPNGGYFQSGSIYERHFTTGLVAVNPTSQPETLSLGVGYRSVTGQQLPGTMTMQPQSAVIATSPTASTAPPSPTPVSTRPAAPTDLHVTQVTPSSVSLAWTAGNGGAQPTTSYEVFRNGSQIATTPQTQYTDNTVQPGGRYRYSVASVDVHGDVSTPSSAVTVVPSPPPAVSRMTPAAGPMAGGTGVALLGRNLDGVTGIDFGGVEITQTCSGAASGGCFAIKNDGEISVVTPPHPAGAAAVSVSAPSGVAPAGTFLFEQPLPSVSAVSPKVGPLDGGNTVTVTGTDFEGPGFTAATVLFGTQTASNVTVLSPTALQVTAPSQRNQVLPVVDVRVVTSSQDGSVRETSATSSADWYTYAIPPTPSLGLPVPSPGIAAGALAPRALRAATAP